MSEQIPFSEIGRLPLVGMAFPVQAAFSPDGRVLTYLYSERGDLERQLYVLDLDPARSGGQAAPRLLELGGQSVAEDDMSLEDQLRRERARETGLGVTSATWAAEADALLVPLADGLYVVSGLAADPQAPRSVLVLERSSGEALAPTLSPDGSMLAFVREGELFVLFLSRGGEPLRLTHSASEGVRNGLAEYVAQEEMERAAGFWWSPGSGRLAYAEVDEGAVPLYRIVHQARDATGSAAEEAHRYPFAGGENVRFRLGVVAAEGGETLWLETLPDEEYLARVDWVSEERLVAQLETRHQQLVRVVAFDAASGERFLLHEERCEPWVNLHDGFRPLRGGEWLWCSERTGFRHLEVRSFEGELVRLLTAGEWQVDNLSGLDEEAGLVYFTASKDGPTERHLYSVPLGGGEVSRLTPEAGSHYAVASGRAGLFVDRHGSLERPPTVTVRSLADGASVAVLHDRLDPRIAALSLTPPEQVQVAAEDGTELHGLLYRAAKTPGPLVVQVYGGPHAQLAVNDWMPTAALRAQALRRAGVSVLVLDNRGSARRGLAFEAPLFHNMGQHEVADQVRGVAWAVAEGIADPARVGVFGWSYGGYMTLRCLALAPETFKVGVAGAPVTDWDGYDTHYTERYMGHPAEQQEAYAASSVLTRAGDIVGELMLVHGLVDENVHFRHTARLISRLIEAGKEHRLLLFPEERHLPRREEDRAFMEEQVITFLTSSLGVA